MLVKYSQTNWGETQKVIQSIDELDLDAIESRRDADGRLEKKIVDPMIRAFALTNLEKADDGRLAWRINVKAIRAGMPTLAQFAIPDAVIGSQYTGHTFFLVGGKSGYFRSAYLPQIQKLFPKYTIKTIRDAGHWIHADRPQETVDAVADFLDGDAAAA